MRIDLFSIFRNLLTCDWPAFYINNSYPKSTREFLVNYRKIIGVKKLSLHPGSIYIGMHHTSKIIRVTKDEKTWLVNVE